MNKLRSIIRPLSYFFALLPAVLAFWLSQSGCDDDGLPPANRREHMVEIVRGDLYRSGICDQDTWVYAPLRVTIKTKDFNGNGYVEQHFSYWDGVSPIRVLIPIGVGFNMDIVVSGGCHPCCNGVLANGGPVFHGNEDIAGFDNPNRANIRFPVKFMACRPCRIG